MSYQIRPYQTELENSAVKQLSKHRTVCVQLATGGGKTVIFSKLAHRYFHATGKEVLILVHREELMYQTQKTMKSIFDEDMPLIKAGTNWVRDAPAYIGMVESVNLRKEYLPKNIGLIIIDECHNALFNKLHNFFTKELILGFTATAKSSMKREPLNKYYGAIVVGPSIKELIAMGNLCQNLTIEPTDVVDRANLAMASTGDFDITNMANEYRKAKYVSNTLASYIRFSLGKKAIIYNVNVEHSLDVTNLFTLAGFPCRHVDGNTGKPERAEIFKWFKETHNAILCNVGVATMGFDEPTVETIIVNRSTTSMPLWLQMCGRGARPIDENVIQRLQPEYPYQLNKKKKFTIVDMGGNRIEHGDWSDDINWRDIFDYPEAYRSGGVAPTKECPNCGCRVHTATIQCKIPMPTPAEPEAICGHIFDRYKFEELEVLEEFNVVDKSIDIEAMLRFNKNQQNYSVFLEIGRTLIDKAFENDIKLDEVRRRYIFNKYMELAEMWFRRVFPAKWFDREWHEGLARTYIDSYLNSKKNKVYQNA